MPDDYDGEYDDDEDADDVDDERLDSLGHGDSDGSKGGNVNSCILPTKKVETFHFV